MSQLLKITLLTFILSSCSISNRFFYRNQEVHIATVNNNVCKKLQGKVVLYAIFVESEHTNSWTDYDIQSTLDSTRKGMDWIEEQARLKGIDLDIELAFHQKDDEVVPIEGKFAKKTLTGTLFYPNGFRNVDKWADKVGKVAIRSLPEDTSKIVKTKIKPKNRERLIAKLRDKYKTDNIALIYFINNYYTNELSIAMHTGDGIDPEYAIVSFKTPGVISHEFLHLFGALDLYINPFDKRRRNARRKVLAMKEFPYEIMAFPMRELDSLNISPLTEYLIGWEKELDDRYLTMISNKKINVAKY